MSNWTIGQASGSDRDKLVALFGQYLWKEDPEDMYKWKHEDNPAGEVVAWVAKEKETGRIAGTYLMMPWRLKTKNEEILATQCVDAVTDIDFRRKGIYLELGKDCVGKLGKLGYPYSLAFPNPAALSGHMKVGGWHVLGDMIRYVRPLHIDEYVMRKIGSGSLSKLAAKVADNAFSLYERGRRYNIPENISFSPTKPLGHEYEKFWKRIRSEFSILFVRDSKYLNWKYLKTPHKSQMVYIMRYKGEICGYVVFEIGKGYGYIVDMLCALEEKYVYSLIAFALNFFRKENLSAVSYTALEGNIYFESLKKMGFSERPDRSPIVFRSNVDQSPSSDLLDNTQWILTMGDCDIEAIGS